jgi:hypothetical protein
MVLFLGLSPAFYGVLMPKTAIACLVIAAALAWWVVLWIVI